MPDTRPDEEKESPQRMPSVYTNATSLAYGIFDFRIVFAEQRIVGEGKVQQKLLVEIVMSPQHMKVFASAMTEKVAEYEAVFGRIPEETDEGESASPATNE